MAEPGDPQAPRPAHPDPDDLVGFATPDALRGQVREAPAAESPAPEPDMSREPAPDLRARARAADADHDLTREAGINPAPNTTIPATPAWAIETPTPDRRPAQPHGALGLYSVYALILFAVPTLGVSAAIGLLAVTGREPPADPVARSHFIYQQRTLWAAAFTALLGAILIVVNIGVFVLFVLAIWMLARGALGVMRLKAGHAIPAPRHWLF